MHFSLGQKLSLGKLSNLLSIVCQNKIHVKIKFLARVKPTLLQWPILLDLKTKHKMQTCYRIFNVSEDWKTMITDFLGGSLDFF